MSKIPTKQMMVKKNVIFLRVSSLKKSTLKKRYSRKNENIGERFKKQFVKLIELS